MQYDPRGMAASDVYRLMISLVVPRPIAFVSTMSPEGRLNLAPFSYFIAISSKPALIGITFTHRPEDPKDTLRNIRDTGEFVVNVVSEELFEPMVKTSGEYPPEVNEFEISGLATRPSHVVKPPSVAASPAHLECRLEREMTLGNGTFVVGEVIAIDVDDAVYTDGYVDAMKVRPVGRLAGEFYSLMREVTRAPRPRVERRPKPSS